MRFSSLTSHIHADNFSLLDFGCGLGHLRPYLGDHFKNFRYTGVDLVPEFIGECRKNFPDSVFEQISDIEDVSGHYDFVVLSGVFNLLCAPDKDLHLRRVCATLGHLFKHTKVALSCDFMTDKVDFQSPGAFHMNESTLVNIVQGLSHRYSIDHTYMPYEFSVTIYQDQRISRPDNVYLGIKNENSQN